jgi:hypothetical protein
VRLCLIAAKPTDSVIQGFLPAASEPSAAERALAAARAAEGSAAAGSRS